MKYFSRYSTNSGKEFFVINVSMIISMKDYN